MLSVVTLAPNAQGILHHHPEEQWGVLLEGSAVRVQAGEEIPVKKGDFWRTPGNVPGPRQAPGSIKGLLNNTRSPPAPATRSPRANRARIPPRASGGARKPWHLPPPLYRFGMSLASRYRFGNAAPDR